MPPLTIMLKPASGLCNMRCVYCFYADVAARRPDLPMAVMSENTLEAAVENALHYADGRCHFVFQGGEPTLAGLGFFESAVRLQAKHNKKRVRISNAIQTNGLLLDGGWARFLHERRFLVGLSLDGDAHAHDALRKDAAGKGTYNRVTKAAALLAKHGCEYNILAVVTRSAARHARATYNHLKRHKFLQFIACLDDLGGSSSAYSLTPELYGQFLCTVFDAYYEDFMREGYVSVRAFDNYIQLLMGHPPDSCAMSGRCAASPLVEHDGSVYPCDFYALSEWRLGDIVSQPLEEMLGSEKALAFSAFFASRHPDCAACKWLHLCRGGCRRDCEDAAEAHPGKNRLCGAYRMLFEHAYPRMLEIARRARNPRA